MVCNITDTEKGKAEYQGAFETARKMKKENFIEKSLQWHGKCYEEMPEHRIDRQETFRKPK